MPSLITMVRDLILTAFKKRKVKQKEELHRSVSLISFSFDLWSSPNHMALIAVIAYYVDEFGNTRSVSYIHQTNIIFNIFLLHNQLIFSGRNFIL